MADNDKSTEATVNEPQTAQDAGNKVDENKEPDNYFGFKPDDPIVQIASRHGWRPKDKLENPEKAVAPDKFVEAQWDINEATKNGRKRLESQVEQLTREMRRLAEQNAAKSQQELEDTREKLRESRRQAAEAGNAEAVDKLSEQLEELAVARNAKTSNEVAPDSVASEWMERNRGWYHKYGEGAPEDVQEVIEVAEDFYGTYGVPFLQGANGEQTPNPQYIPSRRVLFAKIDREIADYVQTYRPELIGKYQFNGIRPVASSAAPKEDQVESNARQPISDVEGNTSRSTPSGKLITKSQLSQQERSFMESSIFNNPKLTEAKWLEDYNKSLGNL